MSHGINAQYSTKELWSKRPCGYEISNRYWKNQCARVERQLDRKIERDALIEKYTPEEKLDESNWKEYWDGMKKAFDETQATKY